MADKTRYSANLVSDSNLYVDISTDRVGIGTTTPTSKLTVSGGLDVIGHTELDNVNVSGFLTATNASFSGNVSIGGTLTYEDVTNIDAIGLVTARSGVRITSGGLNVVGDTNLDKVNVSGVSTFVGVATFTNNVSIAGTLDVNGNVNFNGSLYQNNQPFVASRWTAGTGDDIYRLNGDVGIGTTNPTSKLHVVGDTRITGILTVGSSSVTIDGRDNRINVGTGVTIHHSEGIQVGENTLNASGFTGKSINIAGIITASSLSVGQQIVSSLGAGIKTSGGMVGIGVTLFDFRGSGISTITSPSSGIATINIIGGEVTSYWTPGTSGIHTLSNVGIGLTEPTDALDVQGNVSITGVTTFTGKTVYDGNQSYVEFGSQGNDFDQRIRMWNGSDSDSYFDIYADSTQAYITNTGAAAGALNISAKGNVVIGGNGFGAYSIIANVDESASLFKSNGERLRTSDTGVTIFGIASATSYTGDGSALTGITTLVTSQVGSYIDVVTSNGISSISYSGPISQSTFTLDDAGFSTTTSNVGIGTSSSYAYVLSVVGVTTFTGNMYVAGNVNSNGVGIFTGGLGDYNDYNKQNFYGTYYGQVTPTLAQQIATSVIAAGQGGIQYNSDGVFTSDPLLIWNQNSNSLGIGTTNPLYATHVVGDINFTGNLYQDGVLRPKLNWSNIGTSVYTSGFVGIGTTLPSVELDVIGSTNISKNLNVNGDVSITGAIDVTGVITASNLKNFEFKGDIITSAVLDEGIDFIADVNFTSKYWSINLVGSAVTESAYYSDMDSSKNVYVVGTTETDVSISKYDQFGDKIWQRSLSGSGFQKATSVGVGTTSVYICGSTSGNNGFVAKYTSSGDVLWRKSFGYAGIGSTSITSIDTAESLIVDSSENVYVVGYGGTVASFEIDIPQYAPNTEILILKYNSSGSFVWKRSIGGVSLDYGFDITKDSSDNIYICGSTTHESSYTFKTYGLYNAFIAKYNSSGTIQWQRGLGSRGIDHANGIDVDSNGNVYVVGYNIPQESTKAQIFLAKYNSSGNIVWQEFLTDSTYSVKGYSVKVGSDNTIYVAGTRSTSTPGKYELIWAKYTDGGASILKRRVYGRSFTDNVKINLDNTDNVYLTSSIDDDLVVMKFTPDGSKFGTYVGLDYGTISLTQSTAGLSTFITTFTEYNATYIGETALNSVGILSVTNYGSGFTTTSNPVSVGIITGFEHSTSFTGSSTGSNLSINILEVDVNGGITSFTINNPGQDYLVGDIVSPLSNESASFRVISLATGTELTSGITTLTAEKTSISKSSFAGNLGIGVSDPNSKLHVVGETKLDGPLNIGGSVGSETIPQTVVSTYENVEWRDLYFEQYELDDLGTAVTGLENTFTPTFNQQEVTIYTPYQLNISIDGIPQPAFLYNTEYVWTSDVLTARSGYTIDYDGNIKFSEAIPMESTIVARVISGRQAQTKLKKYPFSALDIMMH